MDYQHVISFYSQRQPDDPRKYLVTPLGAPTPQVENHSPTATIQQFSVALPDPGTRNSPDLSTGADVAWILVSSLGRSPRMWNPTIFIMRRNITFRLINGLWLYDIIIKLFFVEL